MCSAIRSFSVYSQMKRLEYTVLLILLVVVILLVVDILSVTNQ